MNLDSANLTFASIACGLGLFDAGLCGFLLRRSERRGWAIAFSLGAAVSAAVSSTLMPTAFGLVSLAIGISGLLLVGAQRFSRQTLRRVGPFGWATVGTAGIALAAFGVDRVGRVDVVTEYQPTPEQEAVGALPTMEEDATTFVTTDRGTPVSVLRSIAQRTPEQIEQFERQNLEAQRRQQRLIRSGQASDQTNCHGWVFTGGRYWLNSDQVDTVLLENGYRPASAARPGDVAIYRDDDGQVNHTALVRAVCDDGTVLVEGKWGWMGVFLHKAGDSCFGPTYTFYRSERLGHVLAGLDDAVVSLEVCE
jgi:hypothetical protein